MFVKSFTGQFIYNMLKSNYQIMKGMIFMKKEELLKLGIDEETADKIIKLHNDEISVVTDERDTLKGELETEKKNRKTEKEQLEGALHETKYTNAIDRFISGFKFSSELAREAAASKLKAANMKLLDDGSLEGADNFIKELQKNQPSAFVNDDPKPKILGSGSGGGFSEMTQEEFNKMGYNDRVKFFRENPEDYKKFSAEAE